MEMSKIPLQAPTYGNFITILSIDGGGVRGVIPGIILGFLEAELQKLDGNNARIADYFDVVAGTSTGALVTAMITAPNEEGRPLYEAKDLKDFYLQHSSKIFPQPWAPFSMFSNAFSSITGPKYNGKYLRRLLQEELGNVRVSDTVTNVVIPTFDVKRLQPTIFSTFELKNNLCMDAFLSDVCIATTSAPTYFPPHYFETEDPFENKRQFNLIDGGVAANNPSLVAMGEVTKEIRRGNPDFFPIKPGDYRRFIVISLGTGSAKDEGKYGVDNVAKWGVLGWLTNGGSTPLVDVFMQGSADMVDIHNSVLFQALHSEGNYLRIQDDTLDRNLSSVDNSTKVNMKGLVEVGEKLLEKPVSRVNLDSGKFEPIGDSHENNKDALIRFAKMLSQERRLRHMRSPHGRKKLK